MKRLEAIRRLVEDRAEGEAEGLNYNPSPFGALPLSARSDWISQTGRMKNAPH
jgi:hypothetical protein